MLLTVCKEDSASELLFLSNKHCYEVNISPKIPKISFPLTKLAACLFLVALSFLLNDDTE